MVLRDHYGCLGAIVAQIICINTVLAVPQSQSINNIAIIDTTLVFNSAAVPPPAIVGGIPCDIYIDDQGIDGFDTDELWAGYVNCTDSDQSQLDELHYLYEGDEFYTVADRYTLEQQPITILI